MADTLNRLRVELTQQQTELKIAEAELADRLADIRAFEADFEAKVGRLSDQLTKLEKDIQRYKDHIEMARNRQVYGNAHLSVEEQYRRTWRTSTPDEPEIEPEPLPPADNATQLKQLYRQLARRFHPDLASDEAERHRRNLKMAAINDAYEARSLAELVAVAEQSTTTIDIGRHQQTEAQLIDALRVELGRTQRRLRDIKRALRNLTHRPSVELSLAVKAARRQGRDLLAEIAADFEQKIARKIAERDMLKAQIEQSGLDQGFIFIDR